MDIGLPQVKYLEGVCIGCKERKDLEEKFYKGKSWRAIVVL